MTRLTAPELGITQAQYDALLWTRNALDPSIPDTKLPTWLVFEMDSWGSVEVDAGKLKDQDGIGCGSACCIGGTMEMHMAGMTSKPGDYVPTPEDERLALKIDTELSDNKSLFPLFFRYLNNRNDHQTREGAVAAIDRFFAGNIEDPWLRGDDDED